MANCLGCGYDSYVAEWEVFHKKRAKKPFGSFQQQCVDDGLAAEPVIRALLSEHLAPDCFVLDCGMYKRDHLLATPDGFIRHAKTGELFVLEMKRPRILYSAPRLNHLLQILTQLYCTGVNRALYVCWTPDEGIRWWAVERTAETDRLFHRLLVPLTEAYRKEGDSPPSLAKVVYAVVAERLQVPKPSTIAQLKHTLLRYLSTCHRRLQWPPLLSVTSPSSE